MPAKLLSGRDVSKLLLENLKPTIKELDPKLVVVQVGDDPASASYIKQKIKSCDAVGMRREHRHLPENTTLKELFGVIEELNTDSDVTGFFVQLPLPSSLQKHVPDIIKTIDPKKDIDGFTAYNLGKMFVSTEFEHLPPATPSGVITLLEHYHIPIEGQEVTVVGCSNIVGKPLAVMLLNRGATVTVCHIKTQDTAAHTRTADIVISAVGKPGLITANMIKDGAVCIDVGMTRTEEGLRGDFAFADVAEKASWITPVPGGVGPMTVASLIENCVRAKERQS